MSCEAYQTHPYVWTEGDERPGLTFRHKDAPGAAGNPIDITGWTVQLRLERPDDTVLVKAAPVTDGPNGLAATGAWVTTDLQAGLGQQAKVELRDTSNELRTTIFFLMDVQRRPT